MIAIIDDGVHENYFRHCIVEDLEVYPDFVIQKRKSPFSNSISHGTACATIIHHFAPAAEISSIKILNSETGKCKPDELIAALHWCASHDIKQCNLSLGSVACKDFDMIYEHLKQISNSGMLIIAAQSKQRKIHITCKLMRRYRGQAFRNFTRKHNSDYPSILRLELTYPLILI